MEATSLLLATVTREPTSTSDLYDRIGYLELTRAGLIPYAAFRAELARLAAAGLIEAEAGPEGATMWKLSGSAPS